MVIKIPRSHEKLARRKTVWLPILFIFLFILKFIYNQRKGILLDYVIVGLGVNYIQFGFVRRGLVGSIIYFSGINLVHAALLLYVVSFIAFITLAYFILRRMMVSAIAFLPFVIILGALLLFWSTDIGRTDMLVAAILIMAALAVARARIVTASVCVAVGLAIHEVAVIFGLPLVAATLLDEDRYKSLSIRSAATAGVIFVLSLSMYAASSLLPHSDPHTIVETISSEIPSNYSSDFTVMALDAIVSGIRSVNGTQCAIQKNIHYIIHPFVAIFMVALAILALSEPRLKWTSPAIASVPPILFLWFVSSDMTRWTTLGLLNVWVICAVRNRDTIDSQSRWAWARAACAVAVLVLLYPGVAHLSGAFIAPSPLIEKVVESFLGPPNLEAKEPCDPIWRSVLFGTGR